MNKSEKALNELKKGIQTYVSKMLENAPFDKTLVGLVKGVNSNGLYTVIINQQEYSNLTCLFNGLIQTNDFVKIRVPQNNYNNMYIEGKLNATIQGGGSDNYNSLSNKPQINGHTLSGNLTTSQLGISIPTKTSDLTNDSDFVVDANYIHTDNNYTNSDKAIVDNVTSNLTNKVDKVNGKGLSTNDFTTAHMNKLSGIESGAEVNVQADWNETDVNSDSYIQNKPTIPPMPTDAHIVDLIYPIGSIYTSTINRNPSAYFGGTWDSVGESCLIINNGTTNKTQYKWERTS